MRFSKLTACGRITILAQLRKKYGLYPGRKVMFEANDNSIKITPLVTMEEVEENIGFLGTKGMLLKSLIEEKKLEKES